MTTFTINGFEYDHLTDALVVHVDSQHYDRAYVCEWRPERDSLVVREHWQSDCSVRTDELPMDEAWQLYRFLDASDDVAEAFKTMSVEPAPITPVRRRSA